MAAFTRVDGTSSAQQYIQFDTTYTDGVAEGKLSWNSEDGTLEYGMPGGNVTLQVGQEQLVRVKNNSGSLISNGDVVYFSGASGSRPTVALAQANGEPQHEAAGIATEDIADTDFGYVNVGGLVRGVDTSAFSDGDNIYLSDTTAGGFSTTVPDAPNFRVFLGYCVFSNPSSGIVFVSTEHTHHIQDISNVDNTEPSNDGDFYRWNSSNNRFELSSGILDNLDDVDALNPTEGDILEYVGGSINAWTATTPVSKVGTSFPATPEVGDEFYRTDWKSWWTWNGTYWLENDLRSCSFGRTGTSSSSIFLRCAEGNITPTAANGIGFPIEHDILITGWTARNQVSMSGSFIVGVAGATQLTHTFTSDTVKHLDSTNKFVAGGVLMYVQGATINVGDNFDDSSAVVFYRRAET
jgi:hypothetical protein